MIKWVQHPNPATLFSEWAFVVKKSHWPALGIQFREYTKNKQKYYSYAVASPIFYEFTEGDVFWNPANNQHLQVISDVFPLEIKYGGTDLPSLGYMITPEQFVDWLRTGVAPTKSFQIDKNQSRSEIAKFHEYSQ